MIRKSGSKLKRAGKRHSSAEAEEDRPPRSDLGVDYHARFSYSRWTFAAANARRRAGSANLGKHRVAYWLVKTEPGDYSFADLERDGSTVWSGVTNNQALLNIRKMKRGDRALVYHTGKEKAVIGLARIASDPYPDPRSKDPKRAVIDIVPERRLPRPVTLAAIRGESSLRSFDLVRNTRLSVMPAADAVWHRILTMSEV